MEQWPVANSILTWLCLFFNLVLTLALIRRINIMNKIGRFHMPQMEFLKIGEAAPNFVAQKLDSTIVTLEDYARRKVAFVFVSPNCEACREAIPAIVNLLPRAKQSRISISLVITSESDTARDFVKEFGIRLPVLITPANGEFTHDYKVQGTPFYCIVNEDGNIEATGFLDEKWQEFTSGLNSNPVSPHEALISQEM